MDYAISTQNRRVKLRRAVTCTTLAAILVCCISVIAYIRRQAIRERWLRSQSIETLRSLEARTDADTLVYYVLASRLMNQGSAEDALTAASEAAKSVSHQDGPELSRKVFALQAYLDAKRGRSAEAETAISSAEHLGDEAMTHLARGLIASHHKESAVAINEFKRASAMDPDLSEAWSRLASELILVAEPEEAMGPLRKAVDLTPNDPQVHADLAEGLGRLAHYDEAAKECARAAELAPDDAAFAVLPAIGRASSARSEDDCTQAIQMLMAASQKFPSDQILIELIAGLHLRFGHLEQARLTLQQFLESNPKDSASWLNLSAICARLGDTRAARSSFAKFDAIVGAQSSTVTLAVQSLMHPENPELFVKLSAAYQQAGKLRQAYDAMTHASELRPTDPQISRALSNLQSELDQSAGHTTQPAAGNATL